jgi:hypothetical protein
MRTAIIIAAGLVLLGAMIFAARRSGAASIKRAAMWFLPVWFAAAAVNMWIGVARAGYSVTEELPIFVVIFGLPAAAALLVWWRFSRG